MFKDAKAVNLVWLSKTGLTNLNSGEGGSNYVDVKKYSVNNTPYPYVSGQAMRFYLKEAIRRMSNYEDSCVPDENGETCGKIKSCPICDLFGFMQASSKSNVRVSPVKVAPAMGKWPFESNSTVDFLTRQHRNTEESEKQSADIVNVELGVNIYKSGVAIDLEKIGSVEKYDEDNNRIYIDSLLEKNEIKERTDLILDAVSSFSDYSKQSRLLTDFTPDLVIGAIQKNYNHNLQKAFELDGENLDTNRLDVILSEVKDNSIDIFAGLLPSTFANEEEMKEIFNLHDIELSGPNQVIKDIKRQLNI